MSLFRRKFNVSLQGASAALLWLGLASSSVYGESIGSSPAAYTSLSQSQDEMQTFMRLQSMRDSGQISPADYQRLIMSLAQGNKVGIKSLQAPTPIVPMTAPSVPLVQLQPQAPTPVTPPTHVESPNLSQSFAQIPAPAAAPAPRPAPRIRIADVIARPTGLVRSVTIIDASAD